MLHTHRPQKPRERLIRIKTAAEESSFARWFSRPRSAFKTCGLVGLAIALPFSAAIAAHVELSPALMAAIGLASFVALLGTGMAAKVLTGHEKLIYYRDVIAVLAVAATIPWILHRPALRYMDITILGCGVFHVWGRIGCLVVGCCHGRPSRWGIRYGESHAEFDFPSHYVGVRLFPIQGVESLLVFCLVAFGAATVWKEAPPGAVLAFYIVAYALGRFFIEFARGDAARLYFAGFSEAQWTSLLLAIVVAFAERRAILPASRWHGLAAIGIAVCMVFAMAWRRFDGSGRFEMLHPRHVDEIIDALEHLEISRQGAGLRRDSNGSGNKLQVAETSLGYRISAGRTVMGAVSVEHYSLSRANGTLSRAAAEGLARMIGHLKHDSRSLRLFQGGSGVFHALFVPLGTKAQERHTMLLRRVAVSGSQSQILG